MYFSHYFQLIVVRLLACTVAPSPMKILQLVPLTTSAVWVRISAGKQPEELYDIAMKCMKMWDGSPQLRIRPPS